MNRNLFIHFLLISWSIQVNGSMAIAETEATVGSIPDLTRSIDFERKGEFHLGPTGLKGWIYTGKDFMTTDARQILITEVEPDSAADGVLQVGDVLLGTGGDYFTDDARKSLGRAINEAERSENQGVLKLIRWRPMEGAAPRKGKEARVELKLKVMGTYSDTSPWNCTKSQRILEDALKVLVERNEMGRLGATALALLATGEKEHLAIVHDYLHNAKWARPDFEISVVSGGMISWSSGFHNLLLTEYFLVSGDEYVLPAIREHSVKIAMGQSNGGTWGHAFAWTSQNDGKLHGRLPGYGALNQAGLPCFLSLLLSKKCGVEHPEIDDAISRASRFFEQFIGHGSIGYGYHRPSLEIYANGRNGMSGNGKNGVAAIAFRVAGNREATRFFSRLTASLYNTCEYGHSGNSYSYFWDPLGANSGGPDLAAAFLKELRWYYALTRKADGSFVNQPLGGHYGSGLLDPTAAQVLIATLPRRAIFLTGKGQHEEALLTKKEVEETIAAGRWRLANTDDMTADELIEQLDSWSPIAREWVAKKLAEKDGNFVPRLLQRLEDEHAEARAGACAALGHLGERGVEAVPSLAKALTDKEPIVCIASAYALARIGKPAESAVPDLLRALIVSHESEKMKPKQQALAYALGHARARTAPLYFEGILPQIAQDKDPLEGLDRQLLYPAVTKLLHDPSGRTRGCGAYAFQFFSREDTAAMAQEIYDAITMPAPNYLMFEDNPRKCGLDLLARLRIKEGLPLCFETFDFQRWGAYARFPARFNTLQAYGGSAKLYLPQLREMRSRWKDGEHREMLEQTIRVIEANNNSEPLISLHDLVDERLARDLASATDDEQRIALCRELMAKQPGDYFYQAACLRKIVAVRGDKAFDDLLTAVAHPNEILHEVVVTLAAQMQGAGVTNRWINELNKSDGSRQAGILDVLAKRNDSAALPAVKKYLEQEDPQVRDAAARAAAALDTSENQQEN